MKGEVLETAEPQVLAAAVPDEGAASVVPSPVPQPAGPGTGTVAFLGDATTALAAIEDNCHCPAFAAGTLIETDRGPVPVEDLRPGMLVLTRDHRYQPVRWVGTRPLSAAELAHQPALNPVLIAAGAIGPDLPRRDLYVAPTQRLAVSTDRAEALFGASEVLVNARHLTHLRDVAIVAGAAADYVQILFDSHEIICANGIWAESFQPDEEALGALDETQRDSLLAAFPRLRHIGALAAFVAARIVLNREEAAEII